MSSSSERVPVVSWSARGTTRLIVSSSPRLRNETDLINEIMKFDGLIKETFLSPLLSDDSCPGFPLWTDYCHLKRRLFTLKQYRDCIKDIINIDKLERAWKKGI